MSAVASVLIVEEVAQAEVQQPISQF